MRRKTGEASKAAPFGPVRKIQWLCCAAGRSELSRAELAVLIVLADHINTETGKAWPAFARIAKLASVTVRTAKRAVSRLTALDLIQIAEHGGPGRSNRYRLNWDLFRQDGDGVTDDTMQSAIVTSVATFGDAHSPLIVTPMSPDPFNPSEQEAKDEIEGSQAEGVAAPLRLEACGLPPVNDNYAAFWDAWGRRVTVADTERLIASKVEEGVAITDIIAGVFRFKKYCVDTGKSPRMKPAAFVYGEKWRDDWQLYPAEAAKAKSGARLNKGKAKKGPKVQRLENPWKNNPARKDWVRKSIAESDRCFDEFLKLGGGLSGHKKLVTDKMREWKLANPEPPRYKNVITGETWGGRDDRRPEPDWSPQEQGTG